METMWTFSTKNFTVTWSIYPCDYLDLSWDETGETAAAIESGKFFAFDSVVSVSFQGVIIGQDHLGQSIYENPEDFRDHFGMNQGNWGSYFSDMVREAVREARAYLKNIPPMRETVA